MARAENSLASQCAEELEARYNALCSRVDKAEASTRIRLAATQNIVVVAKTSSGKFYTAQKLVKVTIGGCGG